MFFDHCPIKKTKYLKVFEEAEIFDNLLWVLLALSTTFEFFHANVLRSTKTLNGGFWN